MYCSLQGIDCLHASSIAHRALRLENIFVGSNSNIRIKITLASCLCLDGASDFSNVQGDVGYFAPEMLDLQRGKITSYSAWSADVFSFGVCLYTLVYGSMPFEQGDGPSDMDYSMNGDIELPTMDNRVLSSPLKVRNYSQ